MRMKREEKKNEKQENETCDDVLLCDEGIMNQLEETKTHKEIIGTTNGGSDEID